MFLRKVGHGSAAFADKVLWREFYLQTALSRTYIDIREIEGGLVEEGGKMLLHADGRTASADVACRRQEFLQGKRLHLLITADACGLLQIHLAITWEDTNEVSRFVAMEDDGFEHLSDVFTKAIGHVLNHKEELIHLVDDEIVGHLGFVKETCDVGFLYFFHRE